MKVFALGGAGEFGESAVRALAASDEVDALVIGGRTLERVERLASQLGPGVSAVRIDGTDEQRLASLLDGCDLLLNTAGRAPELRRSALRAAIVTRTHYCDLDDPGPLRDLDAEARSAGVTAIAGNGFSPGILNLVRVHAARQLDEAVEVQQGAVMAWSLGFELVRALDSLVDARQTLAALGEATRQYYDPTNPVTPAEYWLRETWQASGEPVRAWRDGGWVEVDPVEGGAEVPLPGGRTITARPYTTAAGRGEPRTVALQFTGFTPQLDGVLREEAGRVASGTITAEQAARALLETVGGDPQRWLAPGPDFEPLPFFWCSALGHKDGRPARHTCWPAEGLMSERNWPPMTGVPLAAAALRVLRGDVEQRGVLTPRTLFDPLPFFEEVAPLLPEPPRDGKLLRESLEFLD